LVFIEEKPAKKVIKDRKKQRVDPSAINVPDSGSANKLAALRAGLADMRKKNDEDNVESEDDDADYKA